MTEFEMATLHVELFNAIQASLTVFFSVLSGFLALSYLAAHRLKPVMAAVCVAAYGGFEVINILGMSGMLRSYAGLTRRIREFAASGQGLDWHNAHNMPPLWVVESLSTLFLAAGLSSSLRRSTSFSIIAAPMRAPPNASCRLRR